MRTTPQRKSIDDLSDEPVLVPPKIFQRSLHLLKRVKKQLNGMSWGVITIQEVRDVIQDLEHAAKQCVQK